MMNELKPHQGFLPPDNYEDSVVREHRCTWRTSHGE
jgi:hypothetical protein